VINAAAILPAAIVALNDNESRLVRNKIHLSIIESTQVTYSRPKAAVSTVSTLSSWSALEGH